MNELYGAVGNDIVILIRTKRPYRRKPLALVTDRNRRAIGRSGTWWAAMFRDVQFWVPLAVLLGGLILLRAIQ